MHPSLQSRTDPLMVTGICTGLYISGAPIHTCTQTRVMSTCSDTQARTHSRTLACLDLHAGRGRTSALFVHTHVHTAPGTPSFPFLTPSPPSPLTSLGQSHPSNFRSKSASSQGGERRQCAFSPPPPGPRLAVPAPPPTPAARRGMHTTAARGLHRDAAHGGDRAPQPPRHPPRPPPPAPIHFGGLWLPQSWAVSAAAKDGLGVGCGV